VILCEGSTLKYDRLLQKLCKSDMRMWYLSISGSTMLAENSEFLPYQSRNIMSVKLGLRNLVSLIWIRPPEQVFYCKAKFAYIHLLITSTHILPLYSRNHFPRNNTSNELSRTQILCIISKQTCVLLDLQTQCSTSINLYFSTVINFLGF